MILKKYLYSTFSHLSTLVTAGHSVFHENMRNHPNGLVKEMVKTFGPDFRSLLDIDGVHSVKYLVNMRRLEVIASKPGHSQVQTGVWGVGSFMLNYCCSGPD